MKPVPQIYLATETMVLAWTFVAPYHPSAGTTEAAMEGVGVRNENYTLALASAEKSKVAMTTIETKPAFVPKTPLGKAMWEARQRIIAAGEPLEDPRVLLEEFMRARTSW